MNKATHLVELRKGNRAQPQTLKKYKGTKRAQKQRAIKDAW